MTNISKQRLVQNGIDITEEIPVIPVDMLLDSVVGFTHTAFVQFLNDTGHELAAQALDDAWYAREDQWWREPNGFDTRYKHGQEFLDEMDFDEE